MSYFQITKCGIYIFIANWNEILRCWHFLYYEYYVYTVALIGSAIHYSSEFKFYTYSIILENHVPITQSKYLSFIEVLWRKTHSKETYKIYLPFVQCGLCCCYESLYWSTWRGGWVAKAVENYPTLAPWDWRRHLALTCARDKVVVWSRTRVCSWLSTWKDIEVHEKYFVQEISKKVYLYQPTMLHFCIKNGYTKKWLHLLHFFLVF